MINSNGYSPKNPPTQNNSRRRIFGINFVCPMSRAAGGRCWATALKAQMGLWAPSVSTRFPRRRNWFPVPLPRMVSRVLRFQVPRWPSPRLERWKEQPLSVEERRSVSAEERKAVLPSPCRCAETSGSSRCPCLRRGAVLSPRG